MESGADQSLHGYRAYWMRVARHIGLSEAAKAIGVRASDLSAFERGREHALSAEQTDAYLAYLQSAPIPEVEEPEAAEPSN